MLLPVFLGRKSRGLPEHPVEVAGALETDAVADVEDLAVGAGEEEGRTGDALLIDPGGRGHAEMLFETSGDMLRGFVADIRQLRDGDPVFNVEFNMLHPAFQPVREGWGMFTMGQHGEDQSHQCFHGEFIHQKIGPGAFVDPEDPLPDVLQWAGMGAHLDNWRGGLGPEGCEFLSDSERQGEDLQPLVRNVQVQKAKGSSMHLVQILLPGPGNGAAFQKGRYAVDRVGYLSFH